jgi:hypothetical protein
MLALLIFGLVMLLNKKNPSSLLPLVCSGLLRLGEKTPYLLFSKLNSIFSLKELGDLDYFLGIEVKP